MGSPEKQCPIDKKPHLLKKCRSFRAKPVEEHKLFLNKKLICFFKCCGSTKHVAISPAPCWTSFQAFLSIMDREVCEDEGKQLGGTITILLRKQRLQSNSVEQWRVFFLLLWYQADWSMTFMCWWWTRICTHKEELTRCLHRTKIGWSPPTAQLGRPVEPGNRQFHIPSFQRGKAIYSERCFSHCKQFGWPFRICGTSNDARKSPTLWAFRWGKGLGWTTPLWKEWRME